MLFYELQGNFFCSLEEKCQKSKQKWSMKLMEEEKQPNPTQLWWCICLKCEQKKANERTTRKVKSKNRIVYITCY